MHRRIERSAAMPCLRLHHSLEHSTQHVGRDFSLGSVLIHCEGEPFEQMVEGISPDRVGDFAAPLALHGVWLEKATIEERDSTKATGSAPGFGPAIESAEEERLKQVSMEPAATSEAIVNGLTKKVRPSIQPSFALHEVEEQNSRQVEQREIVTLLGPEFPGQSFGKSGDEMTEAGEEALACIFLLQDFREAERKAEPGCGTTSAQSFESLYYSRVRGG